MAYLRRIEFPGRFSLSRQKNAGILGSHIKHRFAYFRWSVGLNNLRMLKKATFSLGQMARVSAFTAGASMACHLPCGY
jgi:hypothetical protein